MSELSAEVQIPADTAAPEQIRERVIAALRTVYDPEIPVNIFELGLVYDVAVAEDYSLVDKIHRGLQAGLERKVLVGRNEPGVQNMHRQLHDVLG